MVCFLRGGVSMEETTNVVTRVFANNFAGDVAWSMLDAIKTNNSDVINTRARFLSDLHGRLKTKRVMLIGFNTTSTYSVKTLDILSKEHNVLAISPFVEEERLTKNLLVYSSNSFGSFIKKLLKVYNMKSSLSEVFDEIANNSIDDKDGFSRYDSVRYLNDVINSVGYAKFSQQLGTVELVIDKQYNNWKETHKLNPESGYAELRKLNSGMLVAFSSNETSLDDVIIMYGRFLKSKGVEYIFQVSKIDVRRGTTILKIRSVSPEKYDESRKSKIVNMLEQTGFRNIVLSKFGGYCIIDLDFAGLFD